MEVDLCTRAIADKWEKYLTGDSSAGAVPRPGTASLQSVAGQSGEEDVLSVHVFAQGLLYSGTQEDVSRGTQNQGGSV
jgi:hypothetical protein